MFKGQTYGGSSFFEMLRIDHSDALPNFADLDWSTVQVPHGTTVLALAYEDGALMAGDRLATEGYQVATRDIEKVFRVDQDCLVAIAGAAGPAIEMVRLFQVELEHYQKLEGQQLTFEGKANRLSHMIRQNLPAAMQGLVVMPLFAGYDHQKGRGRIYKFDITGGRYAEADYYATGSGGKDARSSLKKSFRETNFDRESAIRSAVGALIDAADEDRGTGGFDIGRSIYPTCKLVTASGPEE
ncbi:MAG: proteasome subunit beta, partial [Planctomycetes bacterium]|nr:proteasome subunit beta [Planctomycetota bacterium]